MPGDFTATRQSGGTTVMQSYGAGFVTLDQGGMPLNLKPGSNAKITIPVDSSQLAAPGPEPASIPLLSYDETAGVWREEGVMNLVGDAYVGTVEHFSAINADTLKEDQSCVRVLSPALPGSYRMEVTVPQLGGAAPKVLDRPVDQSTTTEHVIYNLPENTNITLVPYDPVTDYPYGIFVVNTGGKQNPTDPNLPAGPPYDACATEVTLDTILVAARGRPLPRGLVLVRSHQPHRTRGVRSGQPGSRRVGTGRTGLLRPGRSLFQEDHLARLHRHQQLRWR